MSVRSRADDDNGPDMRHMLSMGRDTLREFEEWYEETNDDENAKTGIGSMERPSNFERQLRASLTGGYLDHHTGKFVKYMKYNIPPVASPGLNRFMQNLKKVYEALIPMKGPKSDDDSLPDSINPQYRVRIIQLRQWIKETEKDIIKCKKI
jgi:nicotinic acid mononucleotide adenylyltransferase